MKNFIQPGDAMDYVNTTGGALSSGDVVVIGNRIAVCAGDIADGATGTVNLDGVYELDKIAATAFTQGQDLFWDAGNEELTNVGTGNKPAGQAFKAAGSNDTTAQVKLSGSRKQAANVAALAATAGGSYNQTATQAAYDKIDAILTSLKAAGVMANS